MRKVEEFNGEVEKNTYKVLGKMHKDWTLSDLREGAGKKKKARGCEAKGRTKEDTPGKGKSVLG